MPYTEPVAMPVTTKILIESNKSVKFRTLKASFGDGYSQRAPDGINNKIDSWQVKWGGLTLAELTLVETALDTIGGFGILLWTPCGETVQKKFINANASYTRTRKGSVYEITVELMQVFDIT